MRPRNPKRKGDAVETPPGRPVDDQTPRAFGAAPELDIPQLKKQEKERKGGGVPGYVSSSSGGGLGMNLGAGGARVGSSLAANPGILGSGRVAAALSNFFGGKATLLGGLFASKMGAPLVLAGVAGWGLVLGAAGLKLMGGGLAPEPGVGSMASSMAQMGQSGIVIDKPKNNSLGYLAQANEGEILWDKENPNAPKEAPNNEETVEEPEGAVEPEVPKFEMPDVEALMGDKKGGLDRSGFIKGMTSDTKSLYAGGLGSGAGGFNLKKSLGGTSFKPRKLGQGKTNAMKRIRKKLGARRMSTRRGRASRAMGQLKLARNMSVAGAKSMDAKAARQYATDSFEQGRTIGGDMGSIGGSGVVVPPGSGVSPGINDVSPPPSVGPAGNVTPYQDNVDNAKNLGDNSAMMKMLGMAMIAMGIMLIASGTILKSNHTTFPIGLALCAAGAALIALGGVMLGMSGQQAGAAKQQADQVEQQDQGGVADQIDDCADQAHNDGTNIDDCAPAKRQEEYRQQIRNNSVQGDIRRERNQTYEGIGDAGTTGIEDGPSASETPAQQQ